MLFFLNLQWTPHFCLLPGKHWNPAEGEKGREESGYNLLAAQLYSTQYVVKQLSRIMWWLGELMY